MLPSCAFVVFHNGNQGIKFFTYWDLTFLNQGDVQMLGSKKIPIVSSNDVQLFFFDFLAILNGTDK